MKVKLYKQSFRGKGMLPIDMLRYDQCWPSNQKTILRMITAIDKKGIFTYDIVGIMPFTFERWKDFGFNPLGEMEIIII